MQVLRPDRDNVDLVSRIWTRIQVAWRLHEFTLLNQAYHDRHNRRAKKCSVMQGMEGARRASGSRRDELTFPARSQPAPTMMTRVHATQSGNFRTTSLSC